MNNNMDLPTAREQLVSQQKFHQNMVDALGVAIALLDVTFAPTFKALEDASALNEEKDAQITVLEKKLTDNGIDIKAEEAVIDKP